MQQQLDASGRWRRRRGSSRMSDCRGLCGLLLAAALLLHSVGAASSAPLGPALRFRDDGSLRILQLTDLHLGDADGALDSRTVQARGVEDGLEVG